MKRTIALCLAAISIAVLSGCSPAEPIPVETVTTPGPTITVTAKAAAPQSNDKLTALTAWTACAAIAQANYIKDNPGTTIIAYREGKDSVPGDNGAFAATVGIQLPPDSTLNGGIVALCTIGGTAGNPVVESWTMKDT